MCVCVYVCVRVTIEMLIYKMFVIVSSFVHITSMSLKCAIATPCMPHHDIERGGYHVLL